MERRLAAILAADVVGYSRLMEQDEAATLAALKSSREQLIDRKIADHRGRIVKLMGDGALVEFASIVDAIECAVAIQRGMAERSAEVPADRRIELRIGINLGDVIIDGEDIYGDGVNVAARLESLAEPGSICMSGTAYDTAVGKLEISFDFLGEQQLKNIERPVRVYRVNADKPHDVGCVEQREVLEPQRPSLAVLPFTNMSGDPEQEYFSDGLTEDLITALSLCRSFPVIARTSTFTYKGRATRVQQVAEELGVRYVLEGSVRKAGNRLRITAQLVDAETGHHVWAQKFDRATDDVFEIQDEITQKIATTVQPELAQAELEKAAVKRPENLTAWDFVLRGIAHINRKTHQDYRAARETFRGAIDLDPDYADAWAGLGWSYLREIDFCDQDTRKVLIDQGIEAATRAVELDERSAIAHYVLGTAYVWAEKLQRGISEVETALQLNPYNAQAHMALGNRLDLIGRTAEGISKMEQSLELNPRDPNRPGYMAFLSRAHIGLDQYNKALEWIEKAVRLHPDDPDLQYRLAICLAHLDRNEEAKVAIGECERLLPGFLATRARWRPYADTERNERFFAGLMRHGLMPEADSNP